MVLVVKESRRAAGCTVQGCPSTTTELGIESIMDVLTLYLCDIDQRLFVYFILLSPPHLLSRVSCPFRNMI